VLVVLAALQEKPKAPELRAWLESGPPESSVDVLFVGDGYTSKELGRSGKYWKDVECCSKRLFQDLPFSAYKDRFNVRALFVESEEAGCDRADAEHELDTALDSAFDTREGRLLVFRDEARLKALVETAGPTDIVFVMVNTERYSGAGTCRMRENEAPFCPVCCEEVAKAIHAACGLPWDDAAWHKAHPLSGWR
jgi:IgA peptidase M64